MNQVIKIGKYEFNKTRDDSELIWLEVPEPNRVCLPLKEKEIALIESSLDELCEKHFFNKDDLSWLDSIELSWSNIDNWKSLFGKGSMIAIHAHVDIQKLINYIRELKAQKK